MKNIYQGILNAISRNKKLLAVLLDPEKVDIALIPTFIKKVNSSKATHIFIGGSTDKNNSTSTVVKIIKQQSKLPLLLFPGDFSQISKHADAILFLSLISGRNPEYLIEQHVKAVPRLKGLDLEIIPTGYILIDGGNNSSVERVSKTKPLAASDLDLIKHTALAGEYSGKQLIYLEAGSGARKPVEARLIKEVKSEISIPLIVGGGIRSKEQLDAAYKAGADMVVIGTAFENDEKFFNEIQK